MSWKNKLNAETKPTDQHSTNSLHSSTEQKNNSSFMLFVWIQTLLSCKELVSHSHVGTCLITETWKVHHYLEHS